MKQVALVVACAGLVAGCGGGSSTTTPSTSTQNKSATTRAVALSTAVANGYARSLLPAVRQQLRDQGVDRVGKTTVQCAATGTPNVECLYRLPVRRLNKCGVVELTIFMVDRGHGPETTKGQRQRTMPQLCRTGPDGSTVP